MKIIISGGGTGGHIFPAVSIGKEIKKRFPNATIQYVGASGGMEMDLVPKNGFSIEGVWISGIYRQLNIRNIGRNLLFPAKFFVSLWQAYQIISRVKPDAVVGVGGYASGPLGRVATWKKIPLFICEQNAFPGLTNRWLAPKASKILLGNSDAKQYFDVSKCVVTGNPIRTFDLIPIEDALPKLGLDPNKPTILSLGGSLGAGKLNDAWEGNLQELIDADVQLIWQCGTYYYEDLRKRIPQHPNIQLLPFIEDMAVAYSAADLIVSRAGGSTISELIQLSKPSILVPSPNVAEDHQTKNALSLVKAKAAVLVKDVEAKEILVTSALELLRDAEMFQELQENISNFEKHDAAKEIVDVIVEMI
jgi:UDP-N-acetylglucosamine--N-acetylmuramyl-(pentapeptide) pyrophosphoryl-undecaprenol N-acetylglucosamine transferase